MGRSTSRATATSPFRAVALALVVLSGGAGASLMACVGSSAPASTYRAGPDRDGHISASPSQAGDDGGNGNGLSPGGGGGGTANGGDAAPDPTDRPPPPLVFPCPVPAGYSPRAFGSRLVGWYEASCVMTSEGQVTAWPDQSGLANDAVPAQPDELLPTTSLGDGGTPVIGSRPALVFTPCSICGLTVGTPQQMAVGEYDFLIEAVVRPMRLAAGSTGTIFAYDEQAGPFTEAKLATANSSEDATSWRGTLYSDHEIVAPVTDFDGPAVIAFGSRIRTAELRRNGQTISKAQIPLLDLTIPLDPAARGGRVARVGGGNGQAFSGLIAEIIVIQGAYTVDEQSQLEHHLCLKYQICGS